MKLAPARIFKRLILLKGTGEQGINARHGTAAAVAAPPHHVGLWGRKGGGRGGQGEESYDPTYFAYLQVPAKREWSWQGRAVSDRPRYFPRRH